MGQYSTFPLVDFDNAMTYGLGGCSAAVFVSGGFVHFMHDPIAESVFQYIRSNYDAESGNNILLRVPADSYKWKEPKDKLWGDLEHLPVDLSPYSLDNNCDEYNRTLYVKRREDGIYYTGLGGEWKPLLQTHCSATITSVTVPHWLPLLKAKIAELEKLV
jgi:hypothetical protein